MKSKFLITILVIALCFIAVWAIGANHWYALKAHQQLPAFPVSALLLIGVGFGVILGNPLWSLFVVAAGAIFYFVYDNFVKNKNKEVLVFNQSQLSSEVSNNAIANLETNNKIGKVLSKIALIFILLTLLFIGTLFVIASDAPQGSGMVFLPFILLAWPIVLVVFPVYFGILAIRYSREKSEMYILDKVSFYILLICIGGFFLMVISKLFR